MMRLDLDELLDTSDIVSIHAPLNENTENLIGAEQLQLMKSSALLGKYRPWRNCERGGSCQVRWMNELIAGAALDVFEKEPINPDNPLLKIKNKDRLVLTPHIAWASVEARTELIKGIKENIREFVNK